VDGQMDMQKLLEAAQQMQAQIMSAQQALADSEVMGTSGGGLVTARVSGQGELLGLTISPAVIDTSDPADTAETVADLVVQAERMGPFATAFGESVPGGLDAGSLGLDPGSLGLPDPGSPGQGHPQEDEHE
jgi:nucleoid-associated protein EbfC